jgi:uncharacterized membrane protein YfcA
MDELILVALAGFCASMVDGALGMGFGPTSSSILLTTGLSPAAVSTTVNLAKVATGLSAAAAHWRFRNMDRRLVLRLAVPGSVGALIGVTILASVDGAVLKPVLAVLLLLVGVRILVRFSGPLAAPVAEVEGGVPPFDERGTTAAATTGGVTNGLVGAWGPVVTPFLLHRGLPPRFAIGSVNTAEVAVAMVSSGTLLASLGGDGVAATTVVAMLVGGVVASPLAAWLVRFMPARALGLAVAAFLLVANLRALAEWSDVGRLRWAGYGVVAIVTAVAALRPRWSKRALPAPVPV